jgi:small conductance mechanosensitive channel
MTKDYSYAVLDIAIPYEQNVEVVEDVLRSVAAELRKDSVQGPNILEPLEVLGVEAFGEVSVQLRVRLKTVPIQQWSVGREFRRRIKLAFEARGIEFPHRPVTVRLAGTGRPSADDLPAAEKI